jgi:enoyl-CoA hydratase
VITSELYNPERAVAAGFLDEIVAAADLDRAARDAATRLSALKMDAHAATKLRTRAESLAAIRRAIERDDAAFA